MNKELEQLVKQMLVAIEDAPDRDCAIDAKEWYMMLMANVVLNNFLGVNAELEVVDKKIVEKKQ